MPGERHPAREPRKDGVGARAAGTQHRDLGHRSCSPGFLVCEGGSSSSSSRRKLLGGSAELLAARPAPLCGRSPRRDGSESRRDRKALSALPLHLPPDPSAVLEPAGVPPADEGAGRVAGTWQSWG